MTRGDYSLLSQVRFLTRPCILKNRKARTGPSGDSRLCPTAVFLQVDRPGERHRPRQRRSTITKVTVTLVGSIIDIVDTLQMSQFTTAARSTFRELRMAGLRGLSMPADISRGLYRGSVA